MVQRWSRTKVTWEMSVFSIFRSRQQARERLYWQEEEALFYCSESLAMEPGEGHMGNVGIVCDLQNLSKTRRDKSGPQAGLSTEQVRYVCFANQWIVLTGEDSP